MSMEEKTLFEEFIDLVPCNSKMDYNTNVVFETLCTVMEDRIKREVKKLREDRF